MNNVQRDIGIVLSVIMLHLQGSTETCNFLFHSNAAPSAESDGRI